MDTIESVSSAILVNGKVLMLKRPDTARSFPGVWSLVAGKIEYGESPVEASVREIMEETGIHVHAPDRSGKMVAVREKNTVWKVYPFLFRLKSAEPKLNHENVGFEWVDPKDIPSRKTVRHTHEAVVAMLDI
ncbi:MAG: NUDIX domain-containing protein [Candidatus Methanomethylophilaceae archaeon]